MSRNAISNIEIGDSQADKSVHQRTQPLQIAESRPFAGRIGGNVQFVVHPSDELAKKIPDAAPNFPWKDSFSLVGFNDIEVWKAATIEGVGTCLQVFIAGLYAVGLASNATHTDIGPVTPAAFGSISNFLLISLFIYAGAPVSGGHFNPMITMATFFARFSSLSRTLLYILFQSAGAVVGGFMVRAGLGAPPDTFKGAPGCYIDSSLVTPGQAYALETMTAFGSIFIAFGVGLEPRQAKTLGPALSPMLVGLSIALCTFASGIAKPGYSGASLNPARCLGLMSAAERFNYHYINWCADLTAALANGILYWAIPVYKS